jgi:serine phosphatase RsbU (regulator of sigma subunit)/CHASE2 domain-containing sensor protein
METKRQTIAVRLSSLARVLKSSVAVLLLTLLLLFLFAGTLQIFDYKVYDWALSHGAEYSPDSSIVVIEIDNKTTNNLSWPLGRTYLANLIKYVGDVGASVIVIDILLDNPSLGDSLADPVLSTVLSQYRSVLGVDFEDVEMGSNPRENEVWSSWESKKYLTEYLYESQPRTQADWSASGIIVPLREFLSKNSRLGHIKIKPDKDGTFRRVPILIDYGPRVALSISLEAAMASRNFERSLTHVVRHGGGLSVVYGKTSLDIPTSSSSEALIRFVNTSETYARLSAYDLLRVMIDTSGFVSFDSSFFSGKIVFIGQTAVAAADYGPTPVSNNEPNVYLLANLTQNILDGSFYRVPQLWLQSVMMLGFIVLIIAVTRFLSTVYVILVIVAAVIMPIVVSVLILGSLDYFIPPLSFSLLAAVGLVHYLAIKSRTVESAQQTLTRSLEAVGQEIKRASEIQKMLLPRTKPQLYSYDIEVFHKSCKEVGGDYYDFVQYSRDSAGIFIADVCGKGLPAAMLMSSLRSFFVDKARVERSPSKVISSLSSALSEFLEAGQFVTGFFAVIDERKNELRYVNAGHNPPMRITHQMQVEELTSGGMVLGLEGFSSYDEEVITLHSGDIVVLYTDGVTESLDITGSMYGEERLKSRLIRTRGHDARAVLDELLQDLKSFSGEIAREDDTTMIVITKRR